MKKFSLLALVIAFSFASMAVAQDQTSPSDATVKEPAPAVAAPATDAAPAQAVAQEPVAVDTVMPTEGAAQPMSVVSGGCCGTVAAAPVAQPCCGQATNCCTRNRILRVRRPFFRRARVRGCCN